MSIPKFSIFVSSPQVELKAERKTAARDLDDLVRKGLLHKVGAKRGTHYTLRKK